MWARDIADPIDENVSYALNYQICANDYVRYTATTLFTLNTDSMKPLARPNHTVFTSIVPLELTSSSFHQVVLKKLSSNTG